MRSRYPRVRSPATAVLQCAAHEAGSLMPVVVRDAGRRPVAHVGSSSRRSAVHPHAPGARRGRAGGTAQRDRRELGRRVAGRRGRGSARHRDDPVPSAGPGRPQLGVPGSGAQAARRGVRAEGPGGQARVLGDAAGRARGFRAPLRTDPPRPPAGDQGLLRAERAHRAPRRRRAVHRALPLRVPGRGGRSPVHRDADGTGRGGSGGRQVHRSTFPGCADGDRGAVRPGPDDSGVRGADAHQPGRVRPAPRRGPGAPRGPRGPAAPSGARSGSW